MSNKLIPTSKLKLEYQLHDSYLNNFGAKIYTMTNGCAYIVCDKLGQQIPGANCKFDSLSACEKWVDQIPGSGLGHLSNVLDRLVPGRVTDDAELNEDGYYD